MHLKALRLQGFKSFADSTSLRFEPGVTAVVGPNGCGKSNIADAIRWVLGEQSAKALRGGKMQDVIFEGADTRKPAQLCEVSLLLTNCEKQLGGDFHEIEIMRRVHRDGLGEYFFNGQPCRLRDIQKLFMDTGIGRTSYSIMAQGQIDQILSSKPEERRAVFEEAAGITKYKSQRREALQKLALTDQNLARVNDVIGEVSRQIGSLRRQASKALRHKKLSWRLRHLALAHHGFHHALLAADLERLSNEIIGLRSAADERRAGLQQRLSALDNLKSRRSQLNTALQDALQNASDLRSERERAEGAANVASVTRRGLLERLESSRASLAELDMQLRELAARVDTGASDKQQQLSLLGGADAVFQNRNRELSVVEADLSKHDQQLQQTRFQLLQFESNAARLRTDCSGHDVDQKTAANRHAAALADLDTLRTQQNAAKQTADAAAQRARQAADARDAARKNESAAQDAVAALTREFRDAQKKLQDTDRLIAQHSARLKTLRELRDQWQGFGEGAKAILQRRVSVEGPEPLPVAREMSVRRGFARAVESLLGNAVEAIHVADLPTAASILAQLEAGRLGAAVLHINTPAPTTPPGNLPQGLVPALDALDNPDPAQPAA
ncbi:MAG: AAA family ATPase, partial [Opitutaceae bacterium]|nr:AAA family ATPase [Opitutaceae bacterium]